MDEAKSIVELRNKIKSRKPKFIRQDTNIRIRVRNNTTWRKPKGIHSKMRHHRRGKRKMPSPGYGSPAKAKGMHASGLVPVFVENESQIPQSEEYGIVISGRVGIKKKAEIIKKAGEKKIKILNADADDFMKKFGEFVDAKKKKPKEAKKEDKKEAKKEAKQDKRNEQKPEAPSQDDKKKEDKKEKDKVLTKKV